MAAGEPRFGMLETIREYALERLDERGDGGPVRRPPRRLLPPLAEEAEPALLGPQQLSWLERLDAERDNTACGADMGDRRRRGGHRSADRRRALALLAAARIRRRRAASAWSGCWPRARARKMRGRHGARDDRVACFRAGRPRGGASLRRGEPARPSPAGRRRAARRDRSASWASPPWRWATSTGRARSPRKGRGRAAHGRPHDRGYARFTPASCLPGTGSSTRPSG